MRSLALTLAVLLLTAPAAAEDSPTLKVTAAFDSAKAAVGAEVKFKLTFEVESGFHAYHKDNEGIGTPLKASLTDLAGLEQVGDVTWPKYKVKSDPDFGDEWVLEGTFDLTWKFKVPKDARGTLKLKGKYSAQVCDEEGCHMREGKFEASLAIEDKKPDEKKPDPPKDGKNSRADTDGWTQDFEIGSFGFELPAIELIDATAGNWPSDLPAPPTEGVKSRFSMTPRLSPLPAKPGDEVTLELVFETFDLGHGSGFNYLYHPQSPYGKGLTLALNRTPGLTTAGDWQYPAYKVKPGDEFTEDKELWVWDKKFSINRKLKLAADAKPGKYTLTATATGQVCDEGGCLPFNFGWIVEFEVAAPQTPAKAKTKNIAGLEFFVNYDDAVAEARKLNKLILLDFNGVNCPPCRQMEGRVFTRGDVKPLMMNFVLVSLVTDVDENLHEKELFAKYRPRPTTPIPLYVIVDVDGKELRQIGATLKEPTLFVDFLKGTGESTLPPQPGPDNGTVLRPDAWPKDLPAPATRENTKTKDDPKIPGAFTLSAKFTAEKVRPGGEVTLELNFETFDLGSDLYYFYHPKSPWNGPFRLVLKDAGGLEPKGDWEFPKHVVIAPSRDNGMDKEAWIFKGKFTLTRRFKVPDSAKPGDQFAAQGTWTGQICDKSGCVSLHALDLIYGYYAVLTADSAGAQSAIALPAMEYSETPLHPLNPPPKPENKLDEEINKAGGLWGWLLAAFGFGALTLLTPCVLPVLPMTVGFFVKQSEQKRSPVLTAAIYCACIIGSFTAFGLIASLLLGEQGAQIIATNGWVNLAIGLLFVVFALSFFGLFELRVPTFISSKLSRATFNAQREGRGYLTALLNGSSFSVITFSCTAPIAAAFLAGAVSGSMWTATLTMLVYSAGMALPIFIFGMFPSLLKKMPKSGGWMNALKVVFAFVEIAIAIRYFSWAEIAFRQVVVPEWISRNMVDAVWIACFAAAGLYLLGLFRLPHDHEKVEQIGVVRLLFATLFISFSLFLLPGLLSGQRMGLLDGFLPPRPASHGGGGGNGHNGGNDLHALKWHTDLDEALVEARQTGKPVFVDFTGIICSNCRWVETNIMPENPVISQLAKDFVLVQQWTDKDGDNKAKARWKEFGGRAVPFYVVLGPDGKEIDRLVPPNFINALTVQQFAEFLQRSKTRASVAR